MTTDITHLWRLIGYASRRRAIVRRIEVHVKGALNYPPIALSYEGVHVGQVLTGKKAADLPVIEHHVRALLNLKTAKAIGLAPPPHFLAVADEVIEKPIAVR